MWAPARRVAPAVRAVGTEGAMPAAAAGAAEPCPGVAARASGPRARAREGRLDRRTSRSGAGVRRGPGRKAAGARPEARFVRQKRVN